MYILINVTVVIEYTSLAIKKFVKTRHLIPTMQAINKMQQFSFIDLFIDLFESALHVSGDKLAHLQEHF